MGSYNNTDAHLTTEPYCSHKPYPNQAKISKQSTIKKTGFHLLNARLALNHPPGIQICSPGLIRQRLWVQTMKWTTG